MIHEFQSRIASIVPTINGWATIEKAQTLASIIITLKPSVVVEIGVFAGRSAIPMALACQRNNFGKVTAIDAWSNATAAKNEVKEHSEWWSKVDMVSVKAEFEKKIAELNLKNFIDVVQSKSDDVVPPDMIDVLHVDGSHTDQAIDDVERFAKHVRVGGILILDDIHWVSGGVMRAVDAAKDMGFTELFHVVGKESASSSENDWMVMQRTSIA